MELTPEIIPPMAAAIRAALEPFVDADWSTPIPGQDWSCWAAGVHLADAYLAHAAQTLGRPQDGWVPLVLNVEAGAGGRGLLDALDVTAELLRLAATSAQPTDRSFHPWGLADPLGSVAMGVVEGLVHTYDIAGAFGSDWRPPASLSEPVVHRLFLDVPDGDATDALLWCTGRIALADRPRLATWRWHSAVR